MIRDPRSGAGKDEQRSPLYLLTGIIIGLIIGLMLSWLIFPALSNGISPAALSPIAKEEYRRQIAMAYASSGDTQRAAARLALLEDRDPIRSLNVQAQLALLDQDSQREARALSQLSQAIYDLVLLRLAEEGDVGLTQVEGSSYSIVEEQNICENASEAPLLKLFVLDSEGLAASGIRLLLKSEGGDVDTFTGLRPELGVGYAEFDLFPGEQYVLVIQDEESLRGIKTPFCAIDGGEEFWGSLLLTLRTQ